jgi:hypothetical protein
VLLLAGAGIVLTRPSVQRNIVLSQLRAIDPGAELDSVRIGLDGKVRLEGLTLQLASGRLSCKNATAGTKLTSLFSRHLQIHALHIDQLEFDATRRAEASPGPSGTDWRVSLATASITNGSVRVARPARAVPGGGQPAQGPFDPATLLDWAPGPSGDGTRAVTIPFAASAEGVDSRSGIHRLDVTLAPATRNQLRLRASGGIRFENEPARFPDSLAAIRAAAPSAEWEFTLASRAPDSPRIEGSMRARFPSGAFTLEAVLRQDTPEKSPLASIRVQGDTAAMSAAEVRLSASGLSQKHLAALDLHPPRGLPAISDVRASAHLHAATGATASPRKFEISIHGDVEDAARRLPALSGLGRVRAGVHGSGELSILPGFSIGGFHTPGMAFTLATPSQSPSPAASPATGDGGGATIAALTLRLSPPESAGGRQVFQAGGHLLATNLAKVLRTETAIDAPLASLKRHPWNLRFDATGDVSSSAPFAPGENWLRSASLQAAPPAAPATGTPAPATPPGASQNAPFLSVAIQQPIPFGALSAAANPGNGNGVALLLAPAASPVAPPMPKDGAGTQGSGPSPIAAPSPAPAVMAPLLRIAAKNFPLELATAFLGGAAINGEATGEITLARDQARSLHVATAPAHPLNLREVFFRTAAGETLLKGFSVKGDASFTLFTPPPASPPPAGKIAPGTPVKAALTPAPAWELAIANALVAPPSGHAGAAGNLSGKLRLRWDASGPEFVHARLHGDPAPLLRQPLLEKRENLDTASLDLQAAYTRAGAVDIRLALRDIAGAPGRLHSLAFSAIGNLAPGVTTLRAPLRLQTVPPAAPQAPRPGFPAPAAGPGAMPTDITLDIAPNPMRAGTWKGTLHGARVNLPALRLLARLLGGTHGGASGTGPEPDTKPFWTPLGTGALTLSINEALLHAPDPEAARPPLPPLQVNDVLATLSANPDALVLESFASRIGSAPLRASARLDWDAHPATPATRHAPAGQSARPLHLAGTLTLQRYPIPDLLARFAPQAREIAEGSFNITAAYSARAATPAALADSLHLRATASSDHGRFRALRAGEGSLGGLAAHAKTINDAVGDVTGLAAKAAEMAVGSGAAPLRALHQLQGYLDDFPYERARLSVERLPDSTLRVRKLHVSNARIRVEAGGAIAAAGPEVPLAKRPLSLGANFAARGEFASTLRMLRLAKPAGEGDTEGTAPPGAGDAAKGAAVSDFPPHPDFPAGTDDPMRASGIEAHSRLLQPGAPPYVRGPDFTLSGTLETLHSDLFFKLLSAAKDAAANAATPLGDLLSVPDSLPIPLPF